MGGGHTFLVVTLRCAALLRLFERWYAFTLAFYLKQKGDRDDAVRPMKEIVKKYPEYKDAKILLQENKGRK